VDELIAGDLSRGHRAEMTLEIPLFGGDDAFEGRDDRVVLLAGGGRAGFSCRVAVQRCRDPDPSRVTSSAFAPPCKQLGGRVDSDRKGHQDLRPGANHERK